MAELLGAVGVLFWWLVYIVLVIAGLWLLAAFLGLLWTRKVMHEDELRIRMYGRGK